MKKIVAIILILCVLGGCTARQTKSDKPTVYVSILPLKSIVGAIVGEDFDIRVVVPKGASPETFEPTPRQMIGMNESAMIFNIGLIPMETRLLERIEAQDKIINLCRGIDLIAGSCGHDHSGHGECGHHPAHGVDPHVWTSPRSLITMTENACNAICKAYPDSVKYAQNHAKLKDQLIDLDRRTANKIAASDITYFLIYHPALTYYARDYGLQQIAIEDEGKEPSARRIAGIIDRARRDNIRNIFYQSQFPASSVEVIARDINAVAIEIDPLAEDAIANIDNITDLITAR